MCETAGILNLIVDMNEVHGYTSQRQEPEEMLCLWFTVLPEECFHISNLKKEIGCIFTEWVSLRKNAPNVKF